MPVRRSLVAAPDRVQDDQRALGPALFEDGRRLLDHLDHEGRAAARQIVAAPTRLNSGRRRRCARSRRHEGAHLGEDGDQRVLAQEGRLAAHVRAGHQPTMPPGGPRLERG
jgi:hypothetical protein